MALQEDALDKYVVISSATKDCTKRSRVSFVVLAFYNKHSSRCTRFFMCLASFIGAAHCGMGRERTVLW